jgi:hypothetical protein
MKLKQYINKMDELAMRKGTIIDKVSFTKNETYRARITLEDGTLFKFEADIYNEDFWDVNFQDEKGRISIQPKGKNVAIELFAALEKVFTDFISKAKPDEIQFSSSNYEKSRVKLYHMVAKKIAKKGNFQIQYMKGNKTDTWMLSKK